MDIDLAWFGPEYPGGPNFPDKPIDIYTNHPWKHPGKAPIWSPCGIGGGVLSGQFSAIFG
jgi:hypothetical protein